LESTFQDRYFEWLKQGPGSTIQWNEDENNGQVTVKRAGTYSFEDIRRELFKNKPKPPRKSLKELKDGIGE